MKTPEDDLFRKYSGLNNPIENPEFSTSLYEGTCDEIREGLHESLKDGFGIDTYEGFKNEIEEIRAQRDFYVTLLAEAKNKSFIIQQIRDEDESYFFKGDYFVGSEVGGTKCYLHRAFPEDSIFSEYLGERNHAGEELSFSDLMDLMRCADQVRAAIAPEDLRDGSAALLADIFSKEEYSLLDLGFGGSEFVPGTPLARVIKDIRDQLHLPCTITNVDLSPYAFFEQVVSENGDKVELTAKHRKRMGTEHFVMADARKLPFDQGTYDCVTMSYLTVDNVTFVKPFRGVQEPAIRELYDEIRRVLKGNGLLAANELGFPEMEKKFMWLSPILPQTQTTYRVYRKPAPPMNIDS